MVRAADNRLVVLDFGAVKIGTKPGTRIGAEGYCAQNRDGESHDPVGLCGGPTLIFLLTGSL